MLKLSMGRTFLKSIRLKNSLLYFDGLLFITDCYFDWERPEHQANKVFIIHTKDHGEVPSWVKYSLDFEQLFSIED